MIFITSNDNLYSEDIEFVCDCCQKKEKHKDVSRDIYITLLTKKKWLYERYNFEDVPTLRTFCCEQCKNKFEKLYNKNNTKTKKKVK